MAVSILVSGNTNPLNGFVPSSRNPQKPRRKALMGTRAIVCSSQKATAKDCNPKKEVQWEHDKFLNIHSPLQEWLPRKHDNICF